MMRYTAPLLLFIVSALVVFAGSSQASTPEFSVETYTSSNGFALDFNSIMELVATTDTPNDVDLIWLNEQAQSETGIATDHGMKVELVVTPGPMPYTSLADLIAEAEASGDIDLEEEGAQGSDTGEIIIDDEPGFLVHYFTPPATDTFDTLRYEIRIAVWEHDGLYYRMEQHLAGYLFADSGFGNLNAVWTQMLYTFHFTDSPSGLPNTGGPP